MNKTKNRHEVNLPDEYLEILRSLAEKDGRPLKNYLEKILIKHADRTGKKNGTPKEQIHQNPS